MMVFKSFHIVGSYELVRSPEKIWGGPDEDGNWNGMLGLLQREVSHDGGAATKDLVELAELYCISVYIYTK